jgi:hypothetical protein
MVAVVYAATAAIAMSNVVTAARRDAFLQLDDLEAAFPFALVGRRGSVFAVRLNLGLGLAWFHGGTSFRSNSGLRYEEAFIAPARRPSAGAMPDW